MVLNSSGTPQFHLRRCGPASSRPECANFMCFHGTVTTIGRSAGIVDYIICSGDRNQNAIVSRRHARVIRRTEDPTRHLIRDDSRNGIFVNDCKISASPTVLTEGDTVTFGHPFGERLSTGTRVRQPDSEYQYIFEQCHCKRWEEEQLQPPAQLNAQEVADQAFIVPCPPTTDPGRGRSRTQHDPTESRHRDATVCLDTGDFVHRASGTGDHVQRSRASVSTSTQSSNTIDATAVKSETPSTPPQSAISTPQPSANTSSATTSHSVEVQTSEPHSKPAAKTRDEAGNDLAAAPRPAMADAQVQTPEKLPKVQSSHQPTDRSRQSGMVETENVEKPADTRPQREMATATCAIQTDAATDQDTEASQQQIPFSNLVDAAASVAMEMETNDVPHTETPNTEGRPDVENPAEVEEQATDEACSPAPSQGFWTPASAERQLLESESQEFELDVEESPELSVPPCDIQKTGHSTDAVAAESAESQGFGALEEDLDMETDLAPTSMEKAVSLATEGDIAMASDTESLPTEGKTVEPVMTIAREVESLAQEHVVPIATEPEAEALTTEAEVIIELKADVITTEPEADTLATEVITELGEAEAIEPEAEAQTAEAEVITTEPEAEAIQPEAEAQTAEPEAEAIEPEAEAQTAEAEVEAIEPEAEAQTAEAEAITAEPEAEAMESEAEVLTTESEAKTLTTEPDAEAKTTELETDLCVELAKSVASESEPITDPQTPLEDWEMPIVGPQTETTPTEPELTPKVSMAQGVVIVSGTEPIVARSIELSESCADDSEEIISDSQPLCNGEPLSPIATTFQDAVLSNAEDASLRTSAISLVSDQMMASFATEGSKPTHNTPASTDVSADIDTTLPGSDDNDCTTPDHISQVSSVRSDLDVTRDALDMSTQENIIPEDSSQTDDGDSANDRTFMDSETGDVGAVLMVSTPIHDQQHNLTVTDIRPSQSSSEDEAMLSDPEGPTVMVSGLEKDDVAFEAKSELEATRVLPITVTRLEDMKSLVTSQTQVAVVCVPKMSLQQVAALNAGVTLLSVEQESMPQNSEQEASSSEAEAEFASEHPLAEDLDAEEPPESATVIEDSYILGRTDTKSDATPEVPDLAEHVKPDLMPTDPAAEDQDTAVNDPQSRAEAATTPTASDSTSFEMEMSQEISIIALPQRATPQSLVKEPPEGDLQMDLSESETDITEEGAAQESADACALQKEMEAGVPSETVEEGEAAVVENEACGKEDVVDEKEPIIAPTPEGTAEAACHGKEDTPQGMPSEAEEAMPSETNHTRLGTISEQDVIPAGREEEAEKPEIDETTDQPSENADGDLPPGDAPETMLSDTEGTVAEKEDSEVAPEKEDTIPEKGHEAVPSETDGGEDKDVINHEIEPTELVQSGREDHEAESMEDEPVPCEKEANAITGDSAEVMPVEKAVAGEAGPLQEDAAEAVELGSEIPVEIVASEKDSEVLLSEGKEETVPSEEIGDSQPTEPDSTATECVVTEKVVETLVEVPASEASLPEKDGMESMLSEEELVVPPEAVTAEVKPHEKDGAEAMPAEKVEELMPSEGRVATEESVPSQDSADILPAEKECAVTEKVVEILACEQDDAREALPGTAEVPALEASLPEKDEKESMLSEEQEDAKDTTSSGEIMVEAVPPEESTAEVDPCEKDGAEAMPAEKVAQALPSEGRDSAEILQSEKGAAALESASCEEDTEAMQAEGEAPAEVEPYEQDQEQAPPSQKQVAAEATASENEAMACGDDARAPETTYVSEAMTKKKKVPTATLR